MQSPSRRLVWSRLPLAYFGMVAATLGAVLLLVAERPEFRGNPPSGVARSVNVVGHGLTWTGSAAMAVRAAQALRDRRAAPMSDTREVQRSGASTASAEESSPPSAS